MKLNEGAACGLYAAIIFKRIPPINGGVNKWEWGGMHTCRPLSLMLQKQGVGVRRCACAPSSTPRRHHRRRTLQRTMMHLSLSPCPPPSPIINKLWGTMMSVIVIPLPLFPPTLPLSPLFWFYQW